MLITCIELVSRTYGKKNPSINQKENNKNKSWYNLGHAN